MKFLYILLIIFPLTVSAQATSEREVAARELSVINKKFSTASNLYLNLSYLYFTDHSTTTPYFTGTGFLKRKNDLYQSSMMGILTVQNPSCRIIVDSSEKLILVADPVKNVSNGAAGLNMDTLLKVCSSVSVKEISKTEHKIILSFSGNTAEYSSVHIYLDNTSSLKKIVMYSNIPVPADPDNDNSAKAKPRVEILYSEIKTNASTMNVEADEKIYITRAKNGYAPTVKYKDYKVINQRIKG